MTEKPELSSTQLHRVLTTKEYRVFKSPSKKLFAIRQSFKVKYSTAIKAKVVSKDAWKRGIRAERAGREAGRNVHPQAITNDQLETIENQVLVLLSNQTIVRIRDVQNMCVDLIENEPKSKNELKMINKKYASKLIKRSEILKAAIARPTDVAKIKAQSPDNISRWFTELSNIISDYNITSSDIFNFDESSITCGESSSKLVVCFKDQTPPAVPAPPKVPNATICFCVCADGSSLPRFLLYPKKTLPKEFRFLSSFDIRYINSSSGWITKEIYKHIMINCWIPLITEKEKPTSSDRALLLMDNHSTHNDEFVIEAAEKNNIILKRFPPNMTYLLQPCDSCIFSRLKSTLNNKFIIPSPFSLPSYRTQLAEVLPEALAAACTPSTIKAAFIKTGVWPVAAAPVLSRVAGAPIETSALKEDLHYSSQDWREELFGDYSSPKRQSVSVSSKSLDIHSADKANSTKSTSPNESICSSPSNDHKLNPTTVIENLDIFELKKQLEDAEKHLAFLRSKYKEIEKSNVSSTSSTLKTKHSRKEFNILLSSSSSNEDERERKQRKKKKNYEIIDDDVSGGSDSEKGRNMENEKLIQRAVSPAFSEKEIEFRKKYYSSLSL
ncbi:putative transposase Tan1 [Monocercomonoides exilis]|uniref:putative transposase Tan1 n=1 Tax=Monocercomonoides exilis TaxID=2049356 RepID=UPI00355A83D0|nr:putative transposase Tan1 [Monocercomonoides exilis]|eukprot:MONOS_13778.1-p1 / transcript=MONOS_13778.1 / gene=MONOS_13778 / organism=Monocercomonoides_exilis_PA203 / gene_product=transposase Tan1-Aspergillus niger / transcript_product=transposase Tan1-Aspergillus niger / location=Mono_scaffold00882:3606-5487(+) / protein_length=610 / sequence_SO=supercontig / SO=protein_coding / is_pseudo=false